MRKVKVPVFTHLNGRNVPLGEVELNVSITESSTGSLLFKAGVSPDNQYNPLGHIEHHPAMFKLDVTTDLSAVSVDND